MSTECRLSWTCHAAPLSRGRPRASLALRLAGWLLLAAALPALCAVSRSGFAQDLATDVKVANASNQSIQLIVGERRVLHFVGPADSVFLADSAIGDVRVVAPGVGYVYEKQSGTSNLIAVSG